MAHYLGADIFSTRCERLTFKYRHDQQGISIVSGRLSEDVGQVLGLDLVGSSRLRLDLAPTARPAFVDLGAQQVADGRLVIVLPIAVHAVKVGCS